MKIYLAGPLFSSAERAFNAALRDRLQQAGHQVWLPQELEPRGQGAAAVFAKDVEGIEWADVVVANMDGPDPDSGTCWECGFAFRRKPVVLFRTDFRAADEPGIAPYNLMLTESATAHLELPFQSVEQVASTLIDLLTTLPLKKTTP